MLYLNNPLLTSEKIISYVRDNVTLLSEVHPEGSKRPSHLMQLKSKLKANFFANLNKTASDQEVLTELNKDERFTSDYPKLKKVLSSIFSLNDGSDITAAIMDLNTIEESDWDTKNAVTEFAELNARYGYFEDTSVAQLALFTDLAIACRTMIVLFEKNNTPDDVMAYEYAYKLMALFFDPSQSNSNAFDVISKSAHALLSTLDDAKGHPFHDALLVKLDLPNMRDLNDQAGWRAFIKKEGVKAFSFFAMAKKMETKIREQPNESILRAPKDLKEANTMAMLCQYERAGEDHDFAEICFKYKVPEQRFNRCLDYMASGWPKKTNDLIPDVTIQGKDDTEGLYWLKLPATDKRALILGDITDCCQSISGHSEPCVKDGVTLSDNGFYVLVKKRKQGHADLIKEGQINDKDFKIIGQSYVWNSMTGNVCLDSLEGLNGEVRDSALMSILERFAKQVIEENSTIKYVNLGCGGKTPLGLFQKTTIPEKMRQGHAYGDSYSQYSIEKAPLVLSLEQHENLRLMFPEFNDDSIGYIEHYIDSHDSNQFMATLQHLLLECDAAQSNRALVMSNSRQDDMAYATPFLQQAGLLNDNVQMFIEMRVLKLYACQHNLAYAIPILLQAGLLNSDAAQVIFETIAKHRDPSRYASCLVTLQSTGLLSSNLAQTIIEVMAEHQVPSEYAKGLVTLQHSGLLSGDLAQAIFEVMAKHPDPSIYASCLVTLQTAGLLSSNLAQTIIEVMAKHPDPSRYASCLVTLQTAGMLSGDLAQTIIKNMAEHSDPSAYAKGLEILQTTDLLSGDFVQTIFEIMADDRYPSMYASELVKLKTTGLLSGNFAQTIFEVMAKHRNPSAYAWSLVTLQTSGLLSGDLAQIIFEVMAEIWDPSGYASELVKLQNKRLLSGDLAQAIIENIAKNRNPSEYAKGLVTLQPSGLLSGDLAQAIIENMTKHRNPSEYVSGLERLRTEGLLSGDLAPTIIKVMAEHPNPSRYVSGLAIVDMAALLSGDLAHTIIENIAKLSNPSAYAWSLNVLQESGLLSDNLAQTIFENMAKYPDPSMYASDLVTLLKKLKTSGLLSGDFAQINLGTVINHPDISELARTLCLKNGSLCQDDLNQWMTTETTASPQSTVAAYKHALELLKPEVESLENNLKNTL